ncbi:hypothetical protein CPB83DRAFT_909779 [Crepidotus variabilis]|uniref:UvrD-like helicase ATP-binding domain-containing protein n=1 Tax=Crepidotus variabilis TaxID=179855 RepID=A0A9P6JKW2_9AGAR|nr:hypothetical protein CPB83DRAFT_909779 [Crepidotus variabilis]
MACSVAKDVQHCLSLFYDDKLRTEDDICDALQQVVALDTGAYEELFCRLMSPPPEISRPVLELALSSTECGERLGQWLLESLPSFGHHFEANSTAVKVFNKLSLSIPFLYPFEREVTMELNKRRVKVENSISVVKAFIRFLASPSEDERPNEPELNEDPVFLIQTKMSQKQRKDTKTRPVIIFDAQVVKSCATLHVSVPTNTHEATHGLHGLISELYDIFSYYLNLINEPRVEAALRQNIIAISQHGEVQVSLEEQGQKANPADSVAQDISANVPPAFPMVQPMKAALYFESADGFGEWRILISTRADRDLRDFRRRDKKLFTIIVKKIKELSNGHFSDDNQKRLTGVDTEVPIYEAKMTRDSRLVYHIDCVPEYDTEIERQVIKIFGIYTHAQIDKRLWDSISVQLGKKGSEYKRRCKQRDRPKLAGDNVFTPACFPPIEAEDKDERIVPEIPAESLEEIHSLLVLEKFITFSQALLNSIIAELDVAHVFDVSPQEMEIIQYPNSCYVLGRSGTGKTTTMLFKMLGIQRAYEQRRDTMAKPRQVFVTQSRVLAGKVEEYFSKLLDSLSTGTKTKEELAQMIKSKQEQQQDEGLVDADDEQNWRADLPTRFSELQDEHFPLFLTFDKLASLLEEDFRDFLGYSILSPTRAVLSPVVDTTPFGNNESKFITYDTFLTAHWPHFSQNLKKGLDPALVYSELMGVIQGSEESLNHESRYLDEAAYNKLSHRTQYTFATRRDVIYSIFLIYLKQKRHSHSYDAADRTHRILKAIKTTGPPGQKLDFLYVDEAQDNLLIDALLLRSLVKNPDGLFWAGDTAQTISVGSSFRFNDLKAFLYRLEQRREESGAPLAEAPRTFHLAVNYRSHGGIVQCAHSVIELITKFWPYAIDILSREQGVVDGSKPVFFSGWDSETVRYEQFLFGETGNPIEFGAQQCILVRNEAARDELRQQVGEIGLILQGLEFDDVLLYKFFEDSTVDLSQWRVVLNLLEKASQAVVSGLPAPAFDEIKHAGVCSELKFLYVAVTRARKNLWIVDCSDKSEPMRTFWTSRQEIQNCTPGTDVPRLAVSSTPEEWAKTGKSLFSNKRFAQAMHCYERAGLVREAAVAYAYHLRDIARRIALNGSKQSIRSREEAHHTAACAFLESAAASLNVKEKAAYFRNAGSCFEEAHDDFEAAEAYRNAQEYTKAAKLFRKCARFDEAVAIITDHVDQVEVNVVENITDVARLFYFKGGELDKATKLFTSVEEQLEYLEDFDLDISRAALLEQLGKYEDAAEIHLAEGRTLEAIRLFLKDQSDLKAMARGQHCILRGLWEQLSFGSELSEHTTEVDRLLNIAASIRTTDIINSPIGDEISMFNSIRRRDLNNLRNLGKKFDSLGNVAASLLCFDFAFRAIPNMCKMSQSVISTFLQDFFVFCRLLFKLSKMPNLVEDERMRKLFCIHTNNENNYHLPSFTFLHAKLVASRVNFETVDDHGVQIAAWELERRLKGVLMERLVTDLTDENTKCQQAQAFSPCLSYLITSQCNRIDCPNEHLKPTDLTSTWFLLQIRIHLQQILLVQGFSMVHILPGDRIKYYRHWIGRLYNTLYPPSFQLGNIANADLSAIPEWPKAQTVLRTFCNALLFWPNHRRDLRLLTPGYQIIRIAFLVDKANANREIGRSPLTNIMRNIPDYLRTPGNLSTVILPEIACVLLGTHPHGIQFGILCIKTILERCLPIDAHVLCDLIENVAGSIILLRKNGNLHNITLPLSWLNGLLRMTKLDLGVKSPFDYAFQIQILIRELHLLLERFATRQQLLGKCNHLKVGNTDLCRLGSQRGVYIARLCRAICLMGYNVNNIGLRAQIVVIMKGLSQITPQFLFKEYAFVHHWKDVVRALYKGSAMNSSLDEMIQLYHASKAINANPPPQGHRRVLYNNTADVPKLLDGSLSFSNLRADAPAFVPKPPPADGAPAREEGEADEEPEEPELDNSEMVNNPAPVEVLSIGEVPDQNQPRPEELLKAAIIFQQRYRQRQRHNRKIKTSSIDISRQNNFLDCLTVARNIEFPHRSIYRFLFLGPLPHVLVCLSAVHASVMTNKQRNKERFKSAEHQELEDLQKRLTEQKKVLDEIRKLQKALKPASDLHIKRDIEHLKKLVLEVEEMVRRVAPPAVLRDISEDLILGHKGIVEVKKAPKIKPKPKLIIDDGLEDGFYHNCEVDDDYQRGIVESGTTHNLFMPEENVESAREVIVLPKAGSPLILKDDPISAILRRQSFGSSSQYDKRSGSSEEGDEGTTSIEEESSQDSDLVIGEYDDEDKYVKDSPPSAAIQSLSWQSVPAAIGDDSESEEDIGSDVQEKQLAWSFI